MKGKVGSLNAAASAAILLYEAARQRAGAPGNPSVRALDKGRQGG
jgi:tRNA(Leu) C34 or U34 (ribose-2'-O)-methylase TrmL